IEVSVARLPYTLDGFTIEQDIGGTVTTFSIADGEVSYLDTSAPAPILQAPLGLSGTDGTVLARVDLTATVPRPVPGDTVLYTIRQRYAEGLDSSPSAPTAGHRDVEELSLALERGPTPSPGSMTQLVSSTESIAAFGGGTFAWTGQDAEATPVEQRWYRLVVEADGLVAAESAFVAGTPGAQAIPVLTSAVASESAPSITLAGELPPAAPLPVDLSACWRPSSGGVWTCGAASAEIPGAATRVLTGLPRGTRVDVMLRAVHLHGTFDSNVIPNLLTLPSAPAGVQATQGVHEPHVRVSWSHNSGEEVDAYRIYRQGALVQTVPGSASAFEDTAAPAGSVGAPTGLTATNGPTSIQVNWSNPTPQAGAARTYKVVAVNDTGVGESPERTGWRAAPTITGIEFDNSIDSELLAPTAQSRVDSGAPAPSIQSGTLTASEGTSTEHVALHASGFSTSPGATLTYRVRTATNAGSGPWSATATASRSPGPLEYRFLLDAGGGNVQQLRDWGTGNTYNDTDAPQDETPQTYIAEVRATGVPSPVSSNPATGWRAEPEVWTLLSVGTFSSCAIRSSGRLYCWGYNYYGQLGIGTSGNRNRPTQVAGGHTDWFDVHCGYMHCCGIRGEEAEGGELYCWGIANGNRLGSSFGSNQFSPVSMPGGTPSDFRSVRAGTRTNCARRTNGELWCWGTGGSYPCESTSITQCTAAGVTAGGAVETASNTGFAQQEDGTWRSWGYSGYSNLGRPFNNSVQPMSGGFQFDRILASNDGYHRCGIIDSDQSLRCWGENDRGQLGIGNTTNQQTPAVVTGTWSAVGLSDRATCAWNADDNALQCWGRNESFYQVFGTDTPVQSNTPIPMTAYNGPEAVHIGGGRGFFCLLDQDNDIWCWGSNYDGSLGRAASGVGPFGPAKVLDP
ncbi:MAG: hypothetical protein EA398_16165, partial [Deltaproteobacteria bacterium]